MSPVTLEEISLLPRRYAIGKRPLSLLLGWGELTYTRLIDGNKPSPEHAAELRRLIDDPAAYARALEIGRSRVTEMAYIRSFRAVDVLLADRGGAVAATKIYVAADRICKRAGGDITPNALQRLLYYAQGRALADLGSPLFEELPRAAASGPFYDCIAKGYDFEQIQRAAANDVEADSEILSKKEFAAIDSAYDKYRDFSSDALSRMSREEGPWKKARKRASAKPAEDSLERITAKSMRKFFCKK